MTTEDTDPHNVAGRLYLHMVRLLDRLDNDVSITMRERVQAMLGIGHLLRDFAALRKEKGDDDAGSAARKYEEAFDAARRRTQRAGQAGNYTVESPRADAGGDRGDPLDPDTWIYGDEPERTARGDDAGGD